MQLPTKSRPKLFLSLSLSSRFSFSTDSTEGNDNNGRASSQQGNKEGNGTTGEERVRACKICRIVLEIFVPYSRGIPAGKKIASREIGASVIELACLPSGE